MTAQDLHANLIAIRADPHSGAGARVHAFELWLAAACAEGTPPDSLTPAMGDERRRFAESLTVFDDHWFWIGATKNGKPEIRTDGGLHRRAVRVGYEHFTGEPLSPYRDIWAVCGEINCIRPEHQKVGRSPVRTAYEAEAILRKLQVVALRLGHPPSQKDWRRLQLKPSYETYKARWGNWSNALRAAGLDPSQRETPRTYSASDVVAALVAFRDGHDRWPVRRDFRQGSPSDKTIIRRFGTWDAAIVAAKAAQI